MIQKIIIVVIPTTYINAVLWLIWRELLYVDL